MILFIMTNSKDQDVTLNDIIDRLIELKTARGMTDYQLSLASGVNRNVIGRILKKERSLKVETLLKLVEGLDVGLGEFFGVFGE